MCPVEILKISSNSKPRSVAGAIAAILREGGCVELQAIGASAVNQAIKSIAIARGYVASNGIDPICIPSFIKVEIDNEERSAIRLHVCER